MRAAVYRGVNDVRVERVPVPSLGAREALIRIAACGVCGTDLKKIQHGLAEPPRIFGHEMAGTIVALGPEVEGWRVGERVVVFHHIPCLDCYYCLRRDFAQCPTYKKTGTTAGFEPAGGGFAEYVRVMDWIVARGMVRIPDDVSFEEAAFVEPVNTVLKAVVKCEEAQRRRGAGANEPVTPSSLPPFTALVIGQGQIGLLLTQILKQHGATVYATDRLPYRLEAARRFGATEAFSPDACDVSAAIRARTEGRGADLAVVAVANNAVVAQAFEAVRPGGQILLFAQTRLGDPLQIDAGQVCMMEKTLLGSYSSDITLQPQAAELIFRRAINVRDLITHRFPLEEIDAALRMAAAPRDHSLKVMVQP